MIGGMGRFSLGVAALAVSLAGCMNLALSQAIEDPGPHDSPITIIGVGAIGDAAIAAAGAGAHAVSDESLAAIAVARIVASSSTLSRNAAARR